MSTYAHNSAGRLLNLLEQLEGKTVVPHLLVATRKVNPGAVKAMPKIESIKAISELHNVYFKFVEDLENSSLTEEQQAEFTKGLNSLSDIACPTALNQTFRKLSEPERALLRVVATLLKKENVIDNDEFNEIIDKLGELKSLIKSLPNDHILRPMLLELIRLGTDAIDRYDIYGAEGLKKAFKGMLSEVAELQMKNGEATSEIRKTKEWEDTISYITLFDKVASKALQYYPVLAGSANLLLPS